MTGILEADDHESIHASSRGDARKHFLDCRAADFIAAPSDLLVS